MERKTSRNLYLWGLGVAIVATILFIVGTAAAAGTVDASTGQVTNSGAAAFGIFSIIAFLGYAVAGVLATIAWIGALIKTAQLGQWVWFILLLLLSWITMLVYIFAGPTKPKAAM